MLSSVAATNSFRYPALLQSRIFDNRHIGFSTLPKEKQNDAYNVQDMADDVIELVKVSVELRGVDR